MIDDGARQRALDYLGRHFVMSLATHGPDGPWAAAVFYASDGFSLYFVSSPASRHARNCLLQSQAAATVHEDYHDWRAIKGIQLEGTVDQVSATEEANARRLYEEKFSLRISGPADPAIAAALARAHWYKLAPTSAYFIDNSVHFGHRVQVF